MCVIAIAHAASPGDTLSASASQALMPIAKLMAFEAVIADLDHEFDATEKQERAQRFRTERRRRDAFVDLLHELEAKGTLTAASKWKGVYPIIADDARLQEILEQVRFGHAPAVVRAAGTLDAAYVHAAAQPGSTPLDLFKLYIERLNQIVAEERATVRANFRERGIVVQASTTLPEFQELLGSDPRLASISVANASLILRQVCNCVGLRWRR